VVNTVIPFLITIYCYCKVREIMNSRYNSFVSVMRSNYSIIFWYCILPIVCLAPDLLCDVFYLPDSSPLAVQMFTTYLYHFWGILSLFGYWSLTRPKKRNKKNALEQSYTINAETEATLLNNEL